MPLINLIESDLIFARKAEQQTKMSKYTCIVSAAVVGIAYITLMAQGAALGSETSHVEAQIKKLKPLIEQIDDYRLQESDLGPRLSTLTDAQLLTSRWGRVMNHLTVNTPPNIWLTSMRAMMTDPKSPIRITWRGVGKSQADASEMLLRLQNAKDLEGVNLVGTSERILDKVAGIEFEISGDIIGTAEPQPKVEEPAPGA
jgi:Tfp pilus assembly protein PilN